MRVNFHRIEFVFEFLKYKFIRQWISPPYQNSYDFSTDWFSWNIPIWEKYITKNLNLSKKIRALEIGTFEGRSAFWLLENLLTKAGDELFCVDSDPESQRKFEMNFKKGEFKARVKFLQKKSSEVLPRMEKDSFDFIYIDGNHEAQSVFADGELSWGLLKKEGFLVFDDYYWKDKKTGHRPVKEALVPFLDSKAKDFEVVFCDYQLILRKK